MILESQDNRVGGHVKVLRDSDGGHTAYLMVGPCKDIHAYPHHFVLSGRVADRDWPGPSVNGFRLLTEANTFYRQLTGSL